LSLRLFGLEKCWPTPELVLGNAPQVPGWEFILQKIGRKGCTTQGFYMAKRSDLTRLEALWEDPGDDIKRDRRRENREMMVGRA